MNDHAPDRARPASPRRTDGLSTARPRAGESPPGAMQLLQLVMSTADVESYLHEVAVMADDLSPAIGGVGLTLQRDGRVLSVATSNLLAASVDEVQYGMGTGPCLETLRTGKAVSVPDVAHDPRWDGYPPHALSRGVRSSLSVPLSVAGETVGALNAYGTEPEIFTGELAERIFTFGAQAEVALALALRNAQQNDVVEQLHTAMQSRSVIDQALGVLMGRQQCTAEEAFAVLRAASQSRNRKIAEIAADIITATTGQPPTPGRFNH